MKKLIMGLILLSLCGWTCNCFCQAGLETLKADSVRSVTIISKLNDGNGTEKVTTHKKEIERLLGFLAKLKLEQCNPGNCNVIIQKYLFCLSFDGWRDKVYLFSDVIFIAKSRYRIDKDAIGEFVKLFLSPDTVR
jgi:hypothetical protein